MAANLRPWRDRRPILGERVFIDPAAVVTPGKECESRSLYAGSPVRRVRALQPAEIELLSYAARRYVVIKDEYLAAGAKGAG